VSFTVRKLGPEDDRSQFHSGTVDLDRFFALYAGQNQFRHHIGTTYVAVEEAVGGASVIHGFATVSASELVPTAVPSTRSKRLPRYPLAVLRLARLAVDARARGRGVGAVLVGAVSSVAIQMAREIGCVGVVVDAKPEAASFYEKLGFLSLEIVAGELGDRPQPRAMFLALEQIGPRR
jgi:GNAT superfamily N-acetyltransferase